MSDLRIDYSELAGPGDGPPRGGDTEATRRWAFLVLRAGLVAAALLVLPFVVLVRGGVLAYHALGLGTWPALLGAALATAMLLGAYAWVAARRLGAGVRLRRFLIRSAVGVGLACTVYALVFVASANVKSEEVRSEYAELHPLLRVASSVLILVDPASVITDGARTLDEYRRMGLPPNEASLHFEQRDGYVHALDLRTIGRAEWRNRLVEVSFRALGFRALRHVGTADHLHVSLTLPR